VTGPAALVAAGRSTLIRHHSFFLHHSLVIGVVLTTVLGAALLGLTVLHGAGRRLPAGAPRLMCIGLTSALTAALLVDAFGRYRALA
jgi:hypothetical protein